MKKYFCILILLFVFSNKNFAQEVAVETPADPTVLNDYELTKKQYAAWKSIQNNWIVSDYEVIEAENKIKLNCKTCSSFYVEVIIKINASGKFEYYKLLNSKKCGITIDKNSSSVSCVIFSSLNILPNSEMLLLKHAWELC